VTATDPTAHCDPGDAAGRPERLVLLESVSVSHDGRLTWALRDLSVAVRRGERWVVLGPNGSGKSTLVQLVTGYLHPSSGGLELLGGRLGKGVDWRRLRVRIGCVSASFAKLIRPELRAVDVVMTAKHAALEPWWHDYDEADRQRAHALLDAAGFGHVAERPFGVLSEGERQQVQLARTLMGAPELLVLDEPAAGLDLGARERLVARMSAIAAETAVPGMVLVTHHVEEIPAAMTHALVLRSGRSVAAGPVAEVITDEVVGAAFDVDVEIDRTASGRWACRMR
jgi:iron complex transport system ATP-binding protein